MGTSLNGLTPAGTYPGLIKTGDNAPIDGTLKTLSDGNGNNLPMAVSTTTINLTGTAQVGGVAIANTTQVAAKQDTLVSGTNIKTINGTSVLGAGNIVTPTTSPSGVSGAIQFSNGSAFASDAANLFWDDTNNRLGVGTNAPVAGPFQVKTTQSNANGSIIFTNNTTATILAATDTGSALTQLQFRASSYNFTDTAGMRIASMGYATTPTAMLQIVGSGSTAATTSLLVQNSAGATSLKVTDDGSVTNNGKNSLTGNTAFGTNALISVTSGNLNSAFGVDALSLNTSGQLNNAFGRECLLYNSTGGNNAAYGNQALLSNSTASFNAAFGVACLSGNTTGASNSSIGYNTSSGNFSGSVILGREATATANNQFVVGSATTNAGAVNSTTDVPATFLWSVRINGTNYKILMTT